MTTDSLEGAPEVLVDSGSRPDFETEANPATIDLKKALPDWIPVPTGWSILVALPEQKKLSDGGIIIPDQVAEREQSQSAVGLVMAMGPDCYKDQRKFPSGPWCEVGNWVICKAYAGTRFFIEVEKKGAKDGKSRVEYRLLNDDQIQATTSVPEIIKRGW